MPVSIPFAGNASAYCYSADCVPNVARNVVEGTPCVLQPRRAFAFGLDSTGATLVCNAAGVWAGAGPLVGIYNVALPCPAVGLSAQGSDGIPLQCADMGGGDLRWAHRLGIPG
ncbi:MAG: hypothetical protein ACRDU5_03985 [Mycobacterium sp.]